MASYDNTTGIHTMTINEAVGYLKGLPENTKDTPYKVNITNIDLNNNEDKKKVKYFNMNFNYFISAQLYLDLSPTEIIITTQKCVSDLFEYSYFLIKSPRFISKTSDISFRLTFSQCTNLTTVTNLPDSVTDMAYCFLNCTNLKTVPNIPNGVTNMEGTFTSCTNLTTMPNIPDSVTNMKNTFNACRNLTTVTNIPNGVTNMEGTFTSCTNLTTMPNIPDSVTNMKNTFNACRNLTTVTNIPNGVTNMEYCFMDCTNLTTTPNIPDTVTNMEGTFNSCTNLTTVTNIPNGVTNMKITFISCKNLTTMPNIPDSVTDMWYCCKYCTSLKTVIIDKHPIDLSKINMEYCFQYCPNLKEFIYNVEYKEYDDWTLYLLKKIGNNLNIKRYSIETNTLIDEHTISLDNTTNELDLFTKSDELLIDGTGNITDQQIDLLLESRMEFGNKYSLDPRKKWLVVWADNPDNVRSNCFVTQQELQELKTLLKTKHPDLF